jgi:hypothetical protein
MPVPLARRTPALRARLRGGACHRLGYVASYRRQGKRTRARVHRPRRETVRVNFHPPPTRPDFSRNRASPLERPGPGAGRVDHRDKQPWFSVLVSRKQARSAATRDQEILGHRHAACRYRQLSAPRQPAHLSVAPCVKRPQPGDRWPLARAYDSYHDPAHAHLADDPLRAATERFGSKIASLQQGDKEASF